MEISETGMVTGVEPIIRLVGSRVMASRRRHAPAGGTFAVTNRRRAPFPASSTYANRRVRLLCAIEAAVASGSAPARNAVVGASWSCGRRDGDGAKRGGRFCQRRTSGR
jgi:hypothetical protein